MTQNVEARNENPVKTSIGALAVSLLVLAGVFLFVANVLLWADLTLFDSGEFTQATQAALAKEDVQKRLGEALAAEIVQSEELQQRIEQQVPPNLNLAVPVVIDQLEPVIAKVATRIIASERTGRLTSEVIPALHTQLVAILEDDDSRLGVEGDSLVLHLGGTAESVAQRFGIQLPPSEGGGSSRGDVVLIQDASYLEMASVLVKNRQELTLVMLVGAVASFGVAAWRIGNVRETLQKASIVLLAVGIFTLLALLVSNWILSDVFSERIAARELLKSFEVNLQKQSVLLVILGAIGIATTDASVRRVAVDAYNGVVKGSRTALDKYGLGRLMLVAAAVIIILVLVF
jgi:hypothetical protein